MKGTNFDRLVTLVPMNRQAAIVASGKGEAWEPKLSSGSTNSSDPPPRGTYVGPPEHDLTGKRFGQLLVAYYVGKNSGVGSSRGGARWALRCQCGRWEIRSTRGCKAADDPRHPHCDACEYLAGLRAGDEWALNRTKPAQITARSRPP